MTRISTKVKTRMQIIRTAEKLKNIKKTCLIFGISRQYYYILKRRYEQYGPKGLEDRERAEPIMPNRTPDDKEKQIIDYSIEHPTFGKVRVSDNLRMKGVWITSGGIHSIWKRYQMTHRKQRIRKLEEKMIEEGIELNSDQLDAMIQNAGALKERHVISPYPGYLLCQDTFEVGHIKGVGRIYMQTVIDSHGSFGFAKLYTGKTQFETSDILIDKVLPYYMSLGIAIRNILTDNGSEYCGKENEHEYELLLGSLNIKHRRTKIRSPWTNGFVERFNRTVLEEFLVIAFRTKWYYSVDELQKDLDNWLKYYNFKRTHQGYRVNGRTPSEVLMDFSKMPKLLTLNLTKTFAGGVK